MTTPLATARADAVICRAATRALQRGESAFAVTRFLAVYAGLPLVDRYFIGLRCGWEITSEVHERAHQERMQAARERIERIRRWPWSR